MSRETENTPFLARADLDFRRKVEWTFLVCPQSPYNPRP